MPELANVVKKTLEKPYGENYSSFDVSNWWRRISNIHCMATILKNLLYMLSHKHYKVTQLVIGEKQSSINKEVLISTTKCIKTIKGRLKQLGRKITCFSGKFD